MMLEFLLPHALFLSENGFEVELACSDVEDHIGEIQEQLQDGIPLYVVDLPRNPIKKSLLKGYQQIKKIIEEGQFDIVWTNEPVMGVITRLAARKARKQGTKVLYVAHGFHFYKGAPIKNWIVFYPIEKVMSHLTDTLVTITLEDYAFARKKFKIPQIEHIYGIGARTDRYLPASDEKRGLMRKKENISPDAFLVTCVGELNDNKNQKMLIDAVKLLEDEIPEIRVLLAGPGENYEKLNEYIRGNGLQDIIRLLGYRNDLPEIVPAADVAVSCSYREGLPINILEAMVSEIPVVATDNRGHRELISDDQTGFIVGQDDVGSLSKKLKWLYQHEAERKQFGRNGYTTAGNYRFDAVKIDILAILSRGE